jgi:hypothetical protein
MTIDRSFLALFLALSAAAPSGCRDAPLAENVETNRAPVAHAGEMQALDYSGTPVAVTLDGSGSTDSDGMVVTYRWLSAVDAADGGPGRDGPDPDDVRSPTVMLDAGIWTFTLFVIDDEAGISLPSAVTINVGSSVSPEVTECIGAALQTIAADCRECLCGQGEMCLVAITACGQPCWDFYGCVQNHCGDVVDDMAALPDCVRANCSDFFGGVGQYMPLEPCLSREPCRQPCSASVQAM